MAEINTVIAEASQDLQTIEDFVNLPAGSNVRPRLLPSVNVGTLAGTRDAIFRAGGLPAEPFATLAKMQADGASLPDGQLAMVYNQTANNGLYVKTAGVWVKTDYDPLAQANNYTDSLLGNVVRYKDSPLVGTLLDKVFVGSANSGINVTNQPIYVTYKYTISPRKKYKISAQGNSSFRVALMRTVTDNSVTVEADKVDRFVVRDDSLNSVIFESEDEVELYVYLGARLEVGDVQVSVTPYPRVTEGGLAADSLLNPITTELIEDNSVTVDKIDFISSGIKELETERSNINVYTGNPSEPRMYVRVAEGGNNYVTEIPPNTEIKVSLVGEGNTRFRVAVLDTTDVPVVGTLDVDRIITQDPELTEVRFTNTDTGRLLVISLTNNDGDTISAYPIVTATTVNIRGLNIASNTGVGEFKKTISYSLDIGKIENSTLSTLDNIAEYPRLACVKYEYQPDTYPIPVGYLYTTNNAPYELLYSSGKPDNMSKIADWDMSKTYQSNSPPSRYTKFITDDGDIIAVYRGDIHGGVAINPSARQNPIIYPKGDYNNPVEIEFGDRIKPTGWARCNGVTSIPNEDFFVFSEYTRPVHEKCYIWKVTAPFTNPDNWVRVQEFTVSRPASEGGDNHLKHFHAVNYDPFSGALLASVGDTSYGAKILLSKDLGDTWTIEAEGNESKCRLSQVIFTKDYVYWGSDSTGTKHILLRAWRDEDGYPKLTLDDLEVMYLFKSPPSTIATYNTVFLREPHGLLFLHRNDSSLPLGMPMPLHFWSLDEGKMYEVAEVDLLPDVSGEAVGFRCDTVTLYQPLNNDRVTVGFNGIFAKNAMKVAGNSKDNRVNNLTLKVNKIDVFNDE